MTDERNWEEERKREKARMMLEAFSAAAMLGFLAGAQLSGRTITPEQVSDKAVDYAKGLIKRLENEK